VLDKRINAKRLWLDSLLSVTEMHNKTGKVTFITSFGYVVANRFEPIYLDFTNEKTIEESISKAVNEKRSVDMISSADAFYLKRLENFEEKDYNVDSVNLRIYLKDAKLYSYASMDKPINCENLALFSDQIIGVIPGELKVK